MHVALCVLTSIQDCASYCATLNLRKSPCKFDAIGTVHDNGPHSAVGSVIILNVVVVVVVVVSILIIDDDNSIAAASAVDSKSSHCATQLDCRKNWVTTF